MLEVKYFAYGSNIDIERLKGRVERFGEPVEQGQPYVLNNYALVFNAAMKYSTFAFANIIPKKGSKVEGILYDLSPVQFERLDQYEMLYEKQYFQIDRNTIGCVYVAREMTTLAKECKPDLIYLNVIIDGCLETGLIDTYNKLVAFKLANYKLKKISKHKLR